MKIVQPTAIQYNSYQKQPVNNKNRQTSSAPNFKGHAQSEQLFSKWFKILVQQTAFDREPKTKDFVCDYLRKTFNRIKIVSGGCSTGEEPLSYSMRFYDMKDCVNILGIDLGKKAIKQAKSGRFLFETPKNSNLVLDYFDSISTTPYTDSYLVSDTKGLSASQQRFKALFNKFFEPTGEKVKAPLYERLQNQALRRQGIEPLEIERKIYKLKEGKGDNCTFVQGDINNIDTILNGEKVEAISFCNALYHLTTKDVAAEKRVPKKNAENIVETLMQKFRNCLKDGGVVVFGENEGKQMNDFVTVPKVMKRLDFTPLYEAENHQTSVWGLV